MPKVMFIEDAEYYRSDDTHICYDCGDEFNLLLTYTSPCGEEMAVLNDGESQHFSVEVKDLKILGEYNEQH